MITTNYSQANVTLSGGVEIENKTVSSLTEVKTAANTTTIGTVGAGKIWRIIGFALTCQAGASTSTQTLLLNDVACAVNSVIGTATVYNTSAYSQYLSYPSAFVLTAGQTVKVTSSAAGNYATSVFYVEEAV